MMNLSVKAKDILADSITLHFTGKPILGKDHPLASKNEGARYSEAKQVIPTIRISNLLIAKIDAKTYEIIIESHTSKESILITMFASSAKEAQSTIDDLTTSVDEAFARLGGVELVDEDDE